jgi:hypothetical protein
MIESIVSCRNYAEELRILACEKKSIENRLALLRTADIFDQLADAFQVFSSSTRPQTGPGKLGKGGP